MTDAIAPSSASSAPAAPSLAQDFVIQVLKIAAASVLAGLLVEKFKGGGRKTSTTYVVVNEDGEILEELTE